MPVPLITLSVVSHGQNALVNNLLDDIRRVCTSRVAVVITENIPDSLPLKVERISEPVTLIANSKRKGFGANHNAAFAHCRTPYFCVCNPDIRLPSDPFPSLINALADAPAAAAGPLVRSPSGSIEDSARRFPTPTSLAKKVLDRRVQQDYPIDQGPLCVDWCAGMFLLFKSDAFRAVRGFDEAYFLYYEDVDICARLLCQGQSVIYSPEAVVTHDARRTSRRNLRFALHHASSLLRFLWRARFRYRAPA